MPRYGNKNHSNVKTFECTGDYKTVEDDLPIKQKLKRNIESIKSRSATFTSRYAREDFDLEHIRCEIDNYKSRLMDNVNFLTEKLNEASGKSGDSTNSNIYLKIEPLKITNSKDDLQLTAVPAEVTVKQEIRNESHEVYLCENILVKRKIPIALVSNCYNNPYRNLVSQKVLNLDVRQSFNKSPVCKNAVFVDKPMAGSESSLDEKPEPDRDYHERLHERIIKISDMIKNNFEALDTYQNTLKQDVCICGSTPTLQEGDLVLEKVSSINKTNKDLWNSCMKTNLDEHNDIESIEFLENKCNSLLAFYDVKNIPEQKVSETVLNTTSSWLGNRKIKTNKVKHCGDGCGINSRRISDECPFYNSTINKKQLSKPTKNTTKTVKAVPFYQINQGKGDQTTPKLSKIDSKIKPIHSKIPVAAINKKRKKEVDDIVLLQSRLSTDLDTVTSTLVNRNINEIKTDAAGTVKILLDTSKRRRCSAIADDITVDSPPICNTNKSFLSKMIKSAIGEENVNKEKAKREAEIKTLTEKCEPDFGYKFCEEPPTPENANERIYNQSMEYNYGNNCISQKRNGIQDDEIINTNIMKNSVNGKNNKSQMNNPNHMNTRNHVNHMNTSHMSNGRNMNRYNPNGFYYNNQNSNHCRRCNRSHF